MKQSRHAPSVTSVPRAPRDENHARVRTYVITMGIRMLCFVLAVLVTPYGWYTWVFCAGAIFLPYIAVVLANAGSDGKITPAETPSQALEASAAAPSDPPATPVIRIQESRSEHGSDAEGEPS